MRKSLLIIFALLLFTCPLTFAEDLEIWYGHVDGSPVWATLGEVLLIDVYARTQPNVYVTGMMFSLGVMDQYIDSLVSNPNGLFYEPISLWDEKSFVNPQHCPPNPPGWSSQGFLGWADLYYPPGNPWLHNVDAIKILSMAVRVIDDTLILGDTVPCLGQGLNLQWGWSSAWDSTGSANYSVLEHFSPLYFTSESQSCDYIAGDINGDSSVGSADVTFGVRYFKGHGNYPPVYCYLDSSGGYFFPAGDVNGNCEFRGSDIARLVAHLKGLRTLSYCHWIPPIGR
jgi:hypothetical protein